LTPNEEIHILHLIREALSNIVQHANATSSVVNIQYTATGNIEITITDNGKGIETGLSKTHHYGLNIMKERAKTLDGELKIINNPEGGTQVRLLFTPTNEATPVHLKKINE
ncbi:MAG: histidine kinase, partial [Gammaproteobacteria bacterium]|nr:histidine kinase [Gammaproteobacteria bacterium]